MLCDFKEDNVLFSDARKCSVSVEAELNAMIDHNLVLNHDS